MVRAGAAGALLAALGATDLRAANCSDLWVEMEAKTNAFAADVESGATGGMCNATTPPPGCARAEKITDEKVISIWHERQGVLVSIFEDR